MRKISKQWKYLKKWTVENILNIPYHETAKETRCLRFELQALHF